MSKQRKTKVWLTDQERAVLVKLALGEGEVSSEERLAIVRKLAGSGERTRTPVLPRLLAGAIAVLVCMLAAGQSHGDDQRRAVAWQPRHYATPLRSAFLGRQPRGGYPAPLRSFLFGRYRWIDRASPAPTRPWPGRPRPFTPARR